MMAFNEAQPILEGTVLINKKSGKFENQVSTVY